MSIFHTLYTSIFCRFKIFKYMFSYLFQRPIKIYILNTHFLWNYAIFLHCINIFLNDTNIFLELMNIFKF